ncbi:MAG: hypothetical protein KDB90_08805 [Planctomycetes bacterium]|nr:hypothetical protein [Planctomycetota bacterium]
MIFGSYQEVGTIARAVGVGGDVTRVIIENGYGDIKLEAGRSGIVEVIARFKAPPGENYAVSDQDVEITTGDGKLKIRAVEAPKALQRRKIYWEVRIPMSMSVRARNGVGNIEAQGLNGEHDLRTGVGNIIVHAERVCGSSRFRAGTGKVEVHAHRLEGDPGLLTGVGTVTLQAGTAMLGHASLKCATGNITLELPATYIGRIDLKTAVGRIKLGADRAAIPVHTTFVGSRAHGLLGQGPGDIEAKTAVGNITLQRS